MTTSETEILQTNQVTVATERSESGTESEEDAIDLGKTCLAFLEKLDVGDGKKLFQEVEADVENAGRLLFDLFAGDDETKEKAKESVLGSLFGGE